MWLLAGVFLLIAWRGLGADVRQAIPFLDRSEWLSPGLSRKVLDLAVADLSQAELKGVGTYRLSNGAARSIRSGVILVQFTNQLHVGCLRVESRSEQDAVQTLRSRPDVRFAEPDVIQARASSSNDPYLSKQWHHAVIGSARAWDYGMAQSAVRVAIVDSPFQMDHPDLAANVLEGWDVVSNQAVRASAGIAHSTMCAGLVAAVLNNGVGVAGAANCRILPVSITGATSEMCQAVYWAADHGVRVVNISWTGADSDALNAAGAYLRTQARGLLFMAGGNGSGSLDYPNQPDIWCISMTDAADNPRSKYGAAIDFAAPGYAIFSTSIQSGYDSDSGTSYAAPILAGVAARLMTINPLLGPDDVIDILKATAVDLGNPGWDMWFGWGRVDFGAAAAMASARLPRIALATWSPSGVTLATGLSPGVNCQLWRSASLPPASWIAVPGAFATTNGSQLFMTDPSPLPLSGFYRISFP